MISSYLFLELNRIFLHVQSRQPNKNIPESYSNSNICNTTSKSSHCQKSCPKNTAPAYSKKPTNISPTFSTPLCPNITNKWPPPYQNSNKYTPNRMNPKIIKNMNKYIWKMCICMRIFGWGLLGLFRFLWMGVGIRIIWSFVVSGVFRDCWKKWRFSISLYCMWMVMGRISRNRIDSRQRMKMEKVQVPEATVTTKPLNNNPQKPPKKNTS